MAPELHVEPRVDVAGSHVAGEAEAGVDRGTRGELGGALHALTSDEPSAFARSGPGDPARHARRDGTAGAADEPGDRAFDCTTCAFDGAGPERSAPRLVGTNARVPFSGVTSRRVHLAFEARGAVRIVADGDRGPASRDLATGAESGRRAGADGDDGDEPDATGGDRDGSDEDRDRDADEDVAPGAGPELDEGLLSPLREARPLLAQPRADLRHHGREAAPGLLNERGDARHDRSHGGHDEGPDGLVGLSHPRRDGVDSLSDPLPGGFDGRAHEAHHGVERVLQHRPRRLDERDDALADALHEGAELGDALSYPRRNRVANGRDLLLAPRDSLADEVPDPTHDAPDGGANSRDDAAAARVDGGDRTLGQRSGAVSDAASHRDSGVPRATSERHGAVPRISRTVHQRAERRADGVPGSPEQ